MRQTLEAKGADWEPQINFGILGSPILMILSEK